MLYFIISYYMMWEANFGSMSIYWINILANNPYDISIFFCIWKSETLNRNKKGILSTCNLVVQNTTDVFYALNAGKCTKS